MADFWDQLCKTCGHKRGHHGEGGCTASVIGRSQCGCSISQLSDNYHDGK